MRVLGYSLDRFFSHLPQALVFALVVVGIAAIGLVDYSTGHEFSVSVFYLIPITLAAWYIGPHLSALAAFLASVSWFLADRHAGHVYSVAWIPYWNAFMRFGIHAFVAILLNRLRFHLDQERQLALRDTLTGCWNRKFLYQSLQERLSRLGLPGVVQLGLVYIDVDNFKALNDSRGHRIGDRLLQVVVRTIQDHLPVDGSLSRIGGDEFVILREGTDAEIAIWGRDLAWALETEMRSQGWEAISFSIGAIACADSTVQVDHVLDLADRAMYAVKRDGKNGFNMVPAVQTHPIGI